MPSFRNLRNVSSYDAAGHQLCYTDAGEAHRLCADGSHEWRCVSCGNSKGEGACLVATNHTMAVFEIATDLEDDADRKPRPESDCSLSCQDMLRNAGITEGFPGAPAEVRLVQRARMRVRNWARASEQNRAVTVVSHASL
jgi:hypothetical protein